MLLIDEIDKADIEFPNDLLLELDKMEFFVYELNRVGKAKQPADHHHHLEQRKGAAGRVLRRCFFHYIAFPDRETLTKIVDVHYPGIKQVAAAKSRWKRSLGCETFRG